jgi:hypothetical protein
MEGAKGVSFAQGTRQVEVLRGGLGGFDAGDGKAAEGMVGRLMMIRSRGGGPGSTDLPLDNCPFRR